MGKEKAGQYAAANEGAIDFIEKLVQEKQIDCDFSGSRLMSIPRRSNISSKLKTRSKQRPASASMPTYVSNCPAV